MESIQLENIGNTFERNESEAEMVCDKLFRLVIFIDTDFT